jgi:16S rRNA (guanine527-N7)-methyltransferase
MTINGLVEKGLTALEIPCSTSTLDDLICYFNELVKWNKRINLIGEGSDQEIFENHFLDSLTIVPYLGQCPSPGLVDVGSGAGFPGIPLKIVRPELMVTLVEPRKKRASFLRHVVRTLKLQNCEVVECRLEPDLPELAKLKNNTPLLVSRAVTQISPFLEMCLPFCTNGSRVICMKGPKALDELEAWQKGSDTHPEYTLSLHETTTLPFSGIQRDILIFSFSSV